MPALQTTAPVDGAAYEHIRFLGGRRQGTHGPSRVAASNVNRLMARFEFTMAIAVMDISKFDEDEPFAHRVALWYPNHNVAPLPGGVAARVQRRVRDASHRTSLAT